MRRARYNKEQMAEQAVRAFELRITGASRRQISQVLGISTDTVDKRLRDHMRTIVSPKVDEIRKLHDAEYDRLRLKLEAEMQSDNPMIRLRAIELKDKIMTAQRKIHGADAPVQVETTVTEVTQQDIELRTLIREQKAKDLLVQRELEQMVNPDVELSTE